MRNLNLTASDRLGTIIDLPSESVVASRVATIQRNKSFQYNVGSAIARRYPERSPSQFIENRIYDSFAEPGDMRLAEMFHLAPWETRRPILDRMADDRFRELGLRLLGVEAFHCLSVDEQAQFRC